MKCKESPCILTIKESFTSNFDVSVVMPFYKKIKEFKKVFPRNLKYFQRNGIELIIVMDSTDDLDELIGFVRSYPFVNWKIQVNKVTHAWRNPSPAINVGIRNASKKYIFVCSPESEMLTDVIYLLRKTFKDYIDYPHFAYGRVCYADQEVVTYNNYDSIRNIPFGSVMFKKSDIDKVGGYDESFFTWGGDDNNIRVRLSMIGVKGLHVEKAMMVHRDIDNQEGKKRRTLSIDRLNNDQLRHFFYPQSPNPNLGNWGLEFDSLVYDYRAPKYSKDEIIQITKSLGLFDTEVSPYYNPYQTYNRLLLVSCRNEERHIVEFIQNVSHWFDGIVILDDQSEDDSFRLCTSEKVLIKSKKVHVNFSDIDNRNLLLRLACLFSHKLLFFLDVDQRIDFRFCDFEVLDKLGDGTAILVPEINLWDDDNHYNLDYPNSINGFCFRFKGLKSIGNAQIESSKKLHFPQTPTFNKTYVNPNLLILHYGVLSEKERSDKYYFYVEEDKCGDQKTYEHLIDKGIDVSKVSEITKSRLVYVASKIL